MKTVTIYSAFYTPVVGGYIKNVREIAKRLQSDGYSVTIVTCNPGGYPALEYDAGVKVVRLPAWNLLGASFPVPKPSFTLARVMAAKNDVVFTQTRFFPTSLLGALAAWNQRQKHIHVERGTCHSVVDGKGLGVAVRAYDHLFGALVVRLAVKNVGVSQAACDFVGHLGGKNRQVIFNGIAVE